MNDIKKGKRGDPWLRDVFAKELSRRKRRTNDTSAVLEGIEEVDESRDELIEEANHRATDRRTMTFAETYSPRGESEGSLRELKELQARRDVDAFFGGENEETARYHILVSGTMLYLYYHEAEARLIGVFKDYVALDSYIKENLV